MRRIACPAHLAWVRTQDCAAINGGNCCGPIQAHHVRTGQTGGMGLKPLDNFAVSLCAGHHTEGHTIGWRSFEAKYGLDLRFFASELAALSPALTDVPDVF